MLAVIFVLAATLTLLPAVLARLARVDELEVRHVLLLVGLCCRAAVLGPPTLSGVRLTEFWTRMERLVGASYADSYARDQVLATLRGRTVHQALKEGDDTKDVWRAVLAAQESARSK